MGRTNQPLKLVVHPAIAQHPKLMELHDKGHTIIVTPNLEGVHGVIGPNCWMMDSSLLNEGMLDVFLKACRKWSKEAPEKPAFEQPSLF